MDTWRLTDLKRNYVHFATRRKSNSTRRKGSMRALFRYNADSSDCHIPFIPEVWCCIFRFVDYNDMLKSELACKFFMRVIDDVVWKYHYEKFFYCAEGKSSPLSWKQMFRKKLDDISKQGALYLKHPGRWFSTWTRVWVVLEGVNFIYFPYNCKDDPKHVLSLIRSVPPSNVAFLPFMNIGCSKSTRWSGKFEIFITGFESEYLVFGVDNEQDGRLWLNAIQRAKLKFQSQMYGQEMAVG
mmetsp:Transcript_5691/g.6174  ORF Transcript_5691/g.6174 Transcript_5691/m.6174 type:complete len:240 (+) Transcript_5691:49-768(+)